VYEGIPPPEGEKRATTLELFHALADETRLDILGRIEEGEHCVGELADALQAVPSCPFIHLKVLKDAGVIHNRPEGRWIYSA
jgi:ArsR family transcriptional regulator, arsenate/arsenite/antimonite-responsive transcriptional repressor